MRRKRVLFVDVAEPTAVGTAWRAAASLFSGSFDEVVRCRTVTDVYEGLMRHSDGEIGHAQVWGHGYPGNPVIGMPPGPPPKWTEVRKYNLEASHRAWQACEGGSVWFRSCSVAQGEKGHKFVSAMTNLQGIDVVAHLCPIGYWGVQSHLVGVKAGNDPWWPKDLEPGRSNPFMNRTVLSTSMYLPSWAFNTELDP